MSHPSLLFAAAGNDLHSRPKTQQGEPSVHVERMISSRSEPNTTSDARACDAPMSIPSCTIPIKTRPIWINLIRRLFGWGEGADCRFPSEEWLGRLSEAFYAVATRLAEWLFVVLADT